MKRRNFIRSLSSSMIGLPIALNGIQMGVLPQHLSLFPSLANSDKVLVLIRLNGGNDGLNTLIPLDQYDYLYEHRKNVIIPEDNLVRITDTAAFHPSFYSMGTLYQEGKLGIVQSVGYPNQNRSHFRSTDIWTSGSSSEEYVSTGWLGRYLEQLHPEFPRDYPNADHPHPVAITIGNTVSHTCQGAVANFSMTVENLNNLDQLSTGQEGSFSDSYYGKNLEFLHTAIAQTNAYSSVIKQAADTGSNLSRYSDNNWLAQKLKIVARLIAGGMKSNIYIVDQGGYDTHSRQVLSGNPLRGAHANLLSNLSAAVSAFQLDMKLMGLEDRVLGMTFSEFGRRIKANGSDGTDHGDAAPMFLFGTCVNPAILGHNPNIPKSTNRQAGVPMQYDFRSVYGSVLQDWFEVEEEEIKRVLYEDYVHLPLVTCGNFVEPVDASDAFNYPNPFTDSTIITFESEEEQVQIRILDSMGRVVKDVLNKTLRAGTHRIPFAPEQLPSGTYFFNLQKPSGTVTKTMIKI